MSDQYPLPEIVRVLAVGDDPAEVEALRRHLAGARSRGLLLPRVELESVACPVEAIERLSGDGPDLVLLDVTGSAVDEGLALLGRVRAARPDVPVVVLTGRDDARLAVKAIERGAQDYLVQGEIEGEALVRAMRYAIVRHRLLRELESRVEDLARSERRFRQLVEASSDGLVVVDIERRVRYANPTAEAILGRTLADLEGRPFDLPVETDETVEIAIPTPASEDRRYARQRMMKTTWAGEEAFLIYIRDVTEKRRRLEEQRQAEIHIQRLAKLESLGVLAGGIAHDFNNLLMTIVGNAQRVRAALEPGAPARSALASIEKAVDHGSDLTDQLLAYAGEGKVVLGPIDLSSVVAEVADLLRVSIEPGVWIDCRLADDLPAIEADASQVRQVALNLITNAAEATGDAGGRVRVSTGLDERTAEELAGAAVGGRTTGGRFVRIEVADDGCGMDEETAQRIFDPFFTTKFLGRGLGMAAVLGIVRGHQGAIEVDSRRGGPTAIRVLFPALDRPAPASGIESDRPVAWTGSGLALVADDEEDVRNVLVAILQDLGFETVEAADGQEALERYQERPGRFRLALLDVSMPLLTGLDVLRVIRSTGDVPVFLTSGHDERRLCRHYDPADVAGFLRKPFRTDEIAARLREVFGGDG